MFFARLRGRSILAVKGEDAVQFLQGLLTCDVRSLPAFGSLLTARGRWLHSFIVSAAADGLRLDCQGSRLPDLRSRLERYVLRSAVSLEEEDTPVWGLWGDGDLPAAAFADPRGVASLARTYDENFAAGEEKSEEDYESHCLGLGLAIGEPELVAEKSIILENGFDEQNGVSWDKGCYLGQEVMAHIKNHSRIKKSLLVAEFSGSEAAAVELNGKAVGEVRRVIGDTALLLVEVAAIPELLSAPTACGDGELRCRLPAWSATPNNGESPSPR